MADTYFDTEDEPATESYRIRAEIYKKLKRRTEYEADIGKYKYLQKEQNKR